MRQQRLTDSPRTRVFRRTAEFFQADRRHLPVLQNRLFDWIRA
jgi:hypothetical protein